MWAKWAGIPTPTPPSASFPCKVLDCFRDISQGLPESWGLRVPFVQWAGCLVRKGAEGSKSTETLEINLQGLVGEIMLWKLPPETVDFKLKRCFIGGGICLRGLPLQLTRLILTDCKIAGGIDLTALPSALEVLVLSSNKLSEEVCLSMLNPSLRHLDLSQNKLTGAIDLTQLPSSLQELYLHENNFRGSVDLTHLPANLQIIYLRDNPLVKGSFDNCGSIETPFPQNLRVIDVRGTFVTGYPMHCPPHLDIRNQQEGLEVSM